MTHTRSPSFFFRGGLARVQGDLVVVVVVLQPPDDDEPELEDAEMG